MTWSPTPILRALATKLISMPEGGLSSIWDALETDGAADGEGISVIESEFKVAAGAVLLGVDSQGSRHVLVPLRKGEAFAPDRTGRSVHLRRVSVERAEYLSAVCINPQLNPVFARFAWEMISEVVNADSPARTTVEVLAKWRSLLADANPEGLLGTNRMIGLLAELTVLAEILERDRDRDVTVWTGSAAAGSEHDFRRGSTAMELKATLKREGRIVAISSIDQLDAPPDGRLHLVHLRFEPDPNGHNLPQVIERVRSLSPKMHEFDQRLFSAGYREEFAHEYEELKFRETDRTAYSVDAAGFPRIVPSSFVGGRQPPGTLRLSYSIDLTNEPPVPLSSAELDAVMNTMAGH